MIINDDNEEHNDDNKTCANRIVFNTANRTFFPAQGGYKN